jgi:hypothetical protein
MSTPTLHARAYATGKLLGIDAQAAQDRHLSLLAHQRWESEGGALDRPGHPPSGAAPADGQQEVSSAQ